MEAKQYGLILKSKQPMRVYLNIAKQNNNNKQNIINNNPIQQYDKIQTFLQNKDNRRPLAHDIPLITRIAVINALKTV